MQETLKWKKLKLLYKDKFKFNKRNILKNNNKIKIIRVLFPMMIKITFLNYNCQYKQILKQKLTLNIHQ